jgi:hypothetical protein
MEEGAASVSEALRRYITIDDQIRELKDRIKVLQDEKKGVSETVLTFMRANEVDDFKLDGMTGGTLSRSVRTYKPPIKRNTIRTQLFLHFADQPAKVSEALRAIEGIGEGDDMMSGTTKELLTRKIQKKRNEVIV